MIFVPEDHLLHFHLAADGPGPGDGCTSALTDSDIAVTNPTATAMVLRVSHNRPGAFEVTPSSLVLEAFSSGVFKVSLMPSETRRIQKALDTFASAEALRVATEGEQGPRIFVSTSPATDESGGGVGTEGQGNGGGGLTADVENQVEERFIVRFIVPAGHTFTDTASSSSVGGRCRSKGGLLKSPSSAAIGADEYYYDGPGTGAGTPGDRGRASGRVGGVISGGFRIACSPDNAALFRSQARFEREEDRGSAHRTGATDGGALSSSGGNGGSNSDVWIHGVQALIEVLRVLSGDSHGTRRDRDDEDASSSDNDGDRHVTFASMLSVLDTLELAAYPDAFFISKIALPLLAEVGLLLSLSGHSCESLMLWAAAAAAGPSPTNLEEGGIEGVQVLPWEVLFSAVEAIGAVHTLGQWCQDADSCKALRAYVDPSGRVGSSAYPKVSAGALDAALRRAELDATGHSLLMNSDAVFALAPARMYIRRFHVDTHSLAKVLISSQDQGYAAPPEPPQGDEGAVDVYSGHTPLIPALEETTVRNFLLFTADACPSSCRAGAGAGAGGRALLTPLPVNMAPARTASSPPLYDVAPPVLEREETAFLADEFAATLGEADVAGARGALDTWQEAVGTWMAVVDVYDRRAKKRFLRRLALITRTRGIITTAQLRLVRLRRGLRALRRAVSFNTVERLRRRVVGRRVLLRWKAFQRDLPVTPLTRGVAAWTLMRWLACSLGRNPPAYRQPTVADVTRAYDESCALSVDVGVGVGVGLAASTTCTMEPLGLSLPQRAPTVAVRLLEQRGRTYASGRLAQRADRVALYIHALGLMDAFLVREGFRQWGAWARDSCLVRAWVTARRHSRLLWRWRARSAFLHARRSRTRNPLWRLYDAAGRAAEVVAMNRALKRLQRRTSLFRRLGGGRPGCRRGGTGCATERAVLQRGGSFYALARLLCGLRALRRSAHACVLAKRDAMYAVSFARGWLLRRVLDHFMTPLRRHVRWQKERRCGYPRAWLRLRLRQGLRRWRSNAITLGHLKRAYHRVLNNRWHHLMSSTMCAWTCTKRAADAVHAEESALRRHVAVCTQTTMMNTLGRCFATWLTQAGTRLRDRRLVEAKALLEHTSLLATAKASSLRWARAAMVQQAAMVLQRVMRGYLARSKGQCREVYRLLRANRRYPEAVALWHTRQLRRVVRSWAHLSRDSTQRDAAESRKTTLLSAMHRWKAKATPRSVRRGATDERLRSHLMSRLHVAPYSVGTDALRSLDQHGDLANGLLARRALLQWTNWTHERASRTLPSGSPGQGDMQEKGLHSESAPSPQPHGLVMSRALLSEWEADETAAQAAARARASPPPGMTRVELPRKSEAARGVEVGGAAGPAYMPRPIAPPTVTISAPSVPEPTARRMVSLAMQPAVAVVPMPPPRTLSYEYQEERAYAPPTPPAALQAMPARAPLTAVFDSPEAPEPFRPSAEQLTSPYQVQSPLRSPVPTPVATVVSTPVPVHTTSVEHKTSPPLLEPQQYLWMQQPMQQSMQQQMQNVAGKMADMQSQQQHQLAQQAAQMQAQLSREMGEKQVQLAEQARALQAQHAKMSSAEATLEVAQAHEAAMEAHEADMAAHESQMGAQVIDMQASMVQRQQELGASMAMEHEQKLRQLEMEMQMQMHIQQHEQQQQQKHILGCVPARRVRGPSVHGASLRFHRATDSGVVGSIEDGGGSLHRLVPCIRGHSNHNGHGGNHGHSAHSGHRDFPSVRVQRGRMSGSHAVRLASSGGGGDGDDSDGDDSGDDGRAHGNGWLHQDDSDEEKMKRKKREEEMKKQEKKKKEEEDTEGLVAFATMSPFKVDDLQASALTPVSSAPVTLLSSPLPTPPPMARMHSLHSTRDARPALRELVEMDEGWFEQADTWYADTLLLRALASWRTQALRSVRQRSLLAAVEAAPQSYDASTTLRYRSGRGHSSSSWRGRGGTEEVLAAAMVERHRTRQRSALTALITAAEHRAEARATESDAGEEHVFRYARFVLAVLQASVFRRHRLHARVGGHWRSAALVRGVGCLKAAVLRAVGRDDRQRAATDRSLWHVARRALLRWSGRCWLQADVRHMGVTTRMAMLRVRVEVALVRLHERVLLRRRGRKGVALWEETSLARVFSVMRAQQRRRKQLRGFNFVTFSWHNHTVVAVRYLRTLVHARRRAHHAAARGAAHFGARVLYRAFCDLTARQIEFRPARRLIARATKSRVRHLLHVGLGALAERAKAQMALRAIVRRIPQRDAFGTWYRLCGQRHDLSERLRLHTAHRRVLAMGHVLHAWAYVTRRRAHAFAKHEQLTRGRRRDKVAAVFIFWCRLRKSHRASRLTTEVQLHMEHSLKYQVMAHLIHHFHGVHDGRCSHKRLALRRWLRFVLTRRQTIRLERAGEAMEKVLRGRRGVRLFHRCKLGFQRHNKLFEGVRQRKARACLKEWQGRVRAAAHRRGTLHACDRVAIKTLVRKIFVNWGRRAHKLVQMHSRQGTLRIREIHLSLFAIKLQETQDVQHDRMRHRLMFWRKECQSRNYWRLRLVQFKWRRFTYARQRARAKAVALLTDWKPKLRKARFMKILKQMRLWGVARDDVLERRQGWELRSPLNTWLRAHDARKANYAALVDTPMYDAMKLVMERCTTLLSQALHVWHVKVRQGPNCYREWVLKGSFRRWRLLCRAKAAMRLRMLTATMTAWVLYKKGKKLWRRLMCRRWFVAWATVPRCAKRGRVLFHGTHRLITALARVNGHYVDRLLHHGFAAFKRLNWVVRDFDREDYLLRCREKMRFQAHNNGETDWFHDFDEPGGRWDDDRRRVATPHTRKGAEGQRDFARAVGAHQRGAFTPHRSQVTDAVLASGGRRSGAASGLSASQRSLHGTDSPLRVAQLSGPGDSSSSSPSPARSLRFQDGCGVGGGGLGSSRAPCSPTRARHDDAFQQKWQSAVGGLRDKCRSVGGYGFASAGPDRESFCAAASRMRRRSPKKYSRDSFC